MGYYERVRRFSMYKIVVVGVFATILALSITMLFIYFFYYSYLGRLTFISIAGGSLTCLIIYKGILAQIYRAQPYRFCFIGSSGIKSEVESFLDNHEELKLKFQLQESEYSEIENLKQMNDIHDIIVTFEESEIDLSRFIIDSLDMNRRVIDDVTFYCEMFEKVPVDNITPQVLLSQFIKKNRFVDLFLKRLGDVILSLTSIVILSPFLVIIAIAIKLSSKGGVIFSQPRQGQFSKPFKMYKFRTMKQEMSCTDASGGFTEKSDPRVTAIGKIIRPLHLDELPQIVNILKGDMSFVGPRPEALNFAKNMAREIPNYELRYLIKPGLTGHAQIMCGYMLDNIEATKEKLAFDLFYILERNVVLDMRIFVRTFFVVLKQAIFR